MIGKTISLYKILEKREKHIDNEVFAHWQAAPKGVTL